MRTRELIELNRILDEEKNALLRGGVDEILKWSTHKIRLLQLLKDREFTPEEIELVKEIYEKNEKNRKLIETGLNFVYEAYRLLTSLLMESQIYGQTKTQGDPKLISKRA